MQRISVLENEVLDEIISKKVPVTVYIMNGFQYRGLILNHDDSVVIIEAEGKRQMVYKHAISTISPGQMLNALNK